MRSFVAVLAMAASFQGGSAAPVAGEQKTTRTLTHSGFAHATGGFPHLTGGPRRPDGPGPWVRDTDHKGGHHHGTGFPHPTGHHEKGHAHPTNHHKGGHHSSHSGVAKPTDGNFPHKREEEHKPWGHGTGGVPHPTGHHEKGHAHPTAGHGHHTGHHSHSSGVAKPTGGAHNEKRAEEHHGPPFPTGTGHHGGFPQPTARGEDGHGPFIWPQGGFPTSVSFPTLPLPTGILPRPTGHPGDNKKPAAREVAQEENVKRGD
ncbi:hypothetical protein F4818DRAFT_429022 [Hypoxylon cercidicola]|nr:hypothetical protein F4818DRAFT_429022 [Hypoxylon cercidicola]